MKTPNDSPRDDSIALNMTSMIDVVFLLLIFFAFTSDFKKPEKQMPTNLSRPGAVVAPTPPKQEERDLGKIVVRVFVAPSKDVVYAVDGKRFEKIEELENVLLALQNVDPNVPVVVAPEKNAPLESALDVCDCARRVGLAKVVFAASPEALARQARAQ